MTVEYNLTTDSIKILDSRKRELVIGRHKDIRQALIDDFGEYVISIYFNDPVVMNSRNKKRVGFC